MALRSEIPPPPANLTVERPGASDRPTTAMLKADIDSGTTGDKVEHYDVGMAQLGTCEEVAGTPPSSEQIALARKTEAATRSTLDAADPHGRRSWVMPAFAGFIVAAAAIIGGSLWLAP